LAAAPILSDSDAVIRDGLCIGADCPAIPAFNGSTLLFRDLTLALHFEDTTDPLTGHPANDWRGLINDTGSGAPSFFAIEDFTGGRIPFLIEAGAPFHALYLDASGAVGLGTNTPQSNLHLLDGNTPTLRLEQDTGQSFVAQSWDLGGNEANFFVRDVTASGGAEVLPFAVQAGAEDDTLTVGTAGNVGVNTDDPQAPMHVMDTGTPFAANAETMLLLQNTGTSTSRVRMSLVGGAGGNAQIAFGDTDSEFSGRIRYFHTDDRMDFITGFGQPPVVTFDSTATDVIRTSTGARLTAGGIWTNASSRALKFDIAALSSTDAAAVLQGLAPVSFRYTAQPEELTLGFIAEDVPDLVAMGGRETLSPMDLVAVLTRVVQDQNAAIADLEARLAALEAGYATTE